MTTRIYHNPRCSKSRQTLALLQDRDLEPEIVEYLKDPPDVATLSALLDLLGLEPRQLIRTKEEEYRACGADNPDLDRTALIALMVANPKLIERPIVVHDGRAVIGRPPERVLDLF